MKVTDFKKKPYLDYPYLGIPDEDEDNITEEERTAIDIQDRIDSYIRGEMTKEEEIKFLSDCMGNPELKEQAIATACLAKALRSEPKVIKAWDADGYMERNLD